MRASGVFDAGVQQQRNLVSNPYASAYSVLGGSPLGYNIWSPWAGNDGVATVSANYAASWSTGGVCNRIKWTTAPTSGGDNGIVFDGLTPNKTYTLVFTVVTSWATTLRIAAGTWAIKGGAQNSGTGTIQYQDIKPVLPNTPTQFLIVFTPGANTVYAKAYITTSGTNPLPQVGDYMDVSMCRVVEGDVRDLQYSDGNTLGWSWTGVAGQSTSVGIPNTLEEIAGHPLAYYDARYVNGDSNIFEDNFNRADGAAGNGWSARTFNNSSSAPIPTISGNSLVLNSAGITGTDFYMLQDIKSSDCAVEVDYTHNAGYAGIVVRAGVGAASIWFRSNLGATNYWSILLRDSAGNGSSVSSNNNSAFIPTPTDGTTYRLRVECQGVNVRCYVNGVLAITYTETDSSRMAGTLVGVGQFNNVAYKYDNFSARWGYKSVVQQQPSPDTSITTWRDISGNWNDLRQNNIPAQPEFRTRSLNVLKPDEATCEAVSSGVNGYITSYWGTNVSLSTDITPRVGNYVVKGIGGSNNAVYFAGYTWGASQGYRVNAGDKVYVRAWIYHTGATSLNATLHTVFWTPSNASNEGSGASASIPPNTWVELASTGATVPAGNITASWYVNIPTGDQTTPVYIDTVQMSVGQTSNPAWTSPLPYTMNQPTVQFDSGAYMSIGHQLFNSFTGPVTTYAVFRPSKTKSSGNFTIWGQEYAAKMRIVGPTGLAGYCSGWVNNSWAQNFNSPSTPALLKPQIITTVSDVAPNLSLIDSNDAAALTAGSTQTAAGLPGATNSTYGPQEFCVGAYKTVTGGSNDYFEGDIMAVIVFQGAHNAATRATVEKYLAQIYGIPQTA